MDVVVVGSGIIGLLVTRQLLLSSPSVSVALFDAKQPCAGATGAGGRMLQALCNSHAVCCTAREGASATILGLAHLAIHTHLTQTLLTE